MIEQLMIFALGFLVAGLLALLFLPAIWRRALRLSRGRLERRLPLSLAEIAAERDRLRAEFAVDRRRLEQANDALNEARARDRSEMGRLGALVADLTLQVQEQRASVSQVERELAPVRREADETAALAAVLDKELYDATSLAQARLDQIAELRALHAAAADLAEERRGAIASLETRIGGLEIQLDETLRLLAVAERVADEKTAIADVAEQERKTMATTLAAATMRREAAQKTIDDLRARLKEQEKLAREAQRARMRLTAEVAAQSRALQALREIGAGGAGRPKRIRREDDLRAAAEQTQALQIERDMLAGALEAARREVSALHERLAQARPTDAAGDAMLRRAISELGADMLRLTQALERQSDDGFSPAERVQALQRTLQAAS